MLPFVKVIWGARCGESARLVLHGEPSARGHAYSVRRGRESAYDRKAPHGLPPTSLVPTNPFDLWMQRNYSQLRFERYADDVCGNVGWSFIRKRRRLSIASMMIEGNGMPRRSLIFWAIRFVPEAR